MKIDMLKAFNISARVAFAILIASATLLFFPSHWLPFDITEFREEYGFALFLCLIISLSVLLSFLVQWLIRCLKKALERKKTFSAYLMILKGLSDSEKKYLQKLYDKRQSTIQINLNNPVDKKLQTLRIISMSAGTIIGSPVAMPGFVQPWVFQVIDKHPNCLRLFNESAEE